MCSWVTKEKDVSYQTKTNNRTDSSIKNIFLYQILYDSQLLLSCLLKTEELLEEFQSSAGKFQAKVSEGQFEFKKCLACVLKNIH